MAFADEIKRATEELQQFSENVSKSSERLGGGSGGVRGVAAGVGGSGLGGLGRAAGAARGFAGGIGAGFNLVAQALSPLDPAAGLAVQSGSFQGFTSGINKSLLSSVADIPFFGALSGADRAERILGAAAGQASAPLEDLARYGVNVSDELIESQVSVATQQQSRIDRVRGRVSAETYSLDNVDRAAGGANAGNGLGEVTSILRDIRDFITNLVGGAQ